MEVSQHALQQVSRGVPAPGEGVPALGGNAFFLGGACSLGGVEETPPQPADGCCCGRYASYWNAFLFGNAFWTAMVQLFGTRKIH